MDVAFKCNEWPTKMARGMKEAVAKASAEHKQFEQQLKTRRKEFSESLGGLQSRVDAFSGYDVSARRAEYAHEVRAVLLLLPKSRLNVAQEAFAQIVERCKLCAQARVREGTRFACRGTS